MVKVAACKFPLSREESPKVTFESTLTSPSTLPLIAASLALMFPLTYEPFAVRTVP